jgi:hypothetical protein
MLFRALEHSLLAGVEDWTMPHTKRASKRKHPKEIVPVVGVVGVSLSLAGGASAATAPTTETPSWTTALPQLTLTEEEISDVSLATFYVFDRESAMLGTKIAQRGRCGGCGGCRGCAAGARCGGGCAAVARCGGRCAAVARCGCARCGVWRCARCGCSCSGCAAPCWIWGAGWLYIC